MASSIRDNKEGRSFSKVNKEYLRSYQASKEGSEKLSEKDGDKENFKPILDEDSFFANYE